jgi:hypothetical protein
MAGHAPRIGITPLPQAKVAIISSSWHLDICKDLIAGAKRALVEAHVGSVEVQFVPGSFEIPLAAQYAFDKGFDAVAIVRALGLQDLVILTNNPNKVAALRNAGLEVTQQPLVIVSNKFNEKYLATKEAKLGHSRGGK